jgi:C-terminal processing protease CtpA/Prc
MISTRPNRLTDSILVLLCLLCLATSAAAQKMDGIEKERVKSMLKNVKKEIEKNYYDPAFGGMDLEARFKAAEEKLKTVDNLGQALSIVAQAVIDLNDSHTRFIPPSRNVIVDYGWRMKIYGDRCFITRVRGKSDAAARGLKVGDEVLAVNGFRPTRNDIWKMIYYYQQLKPQTQMVLTVKSPDAEPKQLQVAAKITELKRVVDLNNSLDLSEAAREGEKLYSSYKHYFQNVGGTVIWKMPDFAFEPAEVEGLISQARGRQNLILDLRNNPGGYVVTLEKLAGYFFDRDLKIADLKGRKEMEPQRAKTQGDKIFKGKLIVLIDGNSGSAAEIFARLIQLEKRGVVLGDRSAGAVMQSRPYWLDAGVTTSISYGVSVTNADVIMSDGKSLERVGVTPDETILPTGADLAARRDPVLARALELAGSAVSPEAAGKLFPEEKEVEMKTNFTILLREF